MKQEYLWGIFNGNIAKINVGTTFPEDSPNHRNGFWIGWDYDHWGDYNVIRAKTGMSGKKWTTEEIFIDVKNVINQL